MTFHGHNDLEFDLYNDFEGYLKAKDVFLKNLPLFLWLKLLKIKFYSLFLSCKQFLLSFKIITHVKICLLDNEIDLILVRKN